MNNVEFKDSLILIFFLDLIHSGGSKTLLVKVFDFNSLNSHIKIFPLFSFDRTNQI